MPSVLKIHSGVIRYPDHLKAGLVRAMLQRAERALDFDATIAVGSEQGQDRILENRKVKWLLRRPLAVVSEKLDWQDY